MTNRQMNRAERRALGQYKSNKKLADKAKRPAGEEGTITVSFVFDGQLYKKTHQMTEFEVNHMKLMCRENPEAADSLIWKAAVNGAGLTAQSLILLAGKSYCTKLVEQENGTAKANP